MPSTTTSLAIEELQVLTPAQVSSLATEYGSPIFVYSAAALLESARQTLDFRAPYGLTVRYAMKANPLAAILRLFNGAGIQIDASSGYEAHRAILAGVPPIHIMITSQQLPDDLSQLVKLGVQFNATSLHQLDSYGRQFPGTDVSVRLNPGIGSGHNPKTNTGGPASSFGIWHEDIPQIKQLAAAHRLRITKIHTHIGAGTDPEVWHEAARLTLKLVEHFALVTTINLGGGFKVARMSTEESTDLQSISGIIAELLTRFANRTGRRLRLEIEPGTFLVAGAGSLIGRVIDQTSTGETGFTFLKLNLGLTEIMRPSLYGAQHPIITVNDAPTESLPYVVVGHTCESGDLLTPEPGNPEIPATRLLQRASIGDLVVIEGVGAYCASMSAKGYNSFPEAAEVILSANGHAALATRPFSLEDRLQREL